MASLFSLFTGFKGWLAGLGAALIAALGVYLKGRIDGGQIERSRRADEIARAHTISDEIEDAIAGRDANANRERLRKWSR